MRLTGNEHAIVLTADSDCDRNFLAAIIGHQMNGGKLTIETASTAMVISSSGGNARHVRPSKPQRRRSLLGWLTGGGS